MSASFLYIFLPRRMMQILMKKFDFTGTILHPNWLGEAFIWYACLFNPSNYFNDCTSLNSLSSENISSPGHDALYFYVKKSCSSQGSRLWVCWLLVKCCRFNQSHRAMAWVSTSSSSFHSAREKETPSKIYITILTEIIWQLWRHVQTKFDIFIEAILCFLQKQLGVKEVSNKAVLSTIRFKQLQSL